MLIKVTVIFVFSLLKTRTHTHSHMMDGRREREKGKVEVEAGEKSGDRELGELVRASFSSKNKKRGTPTQQQFGFYPSLLGAKESNS